MRLRRGREEDAVVLILGPGLRVALNHYLVGGTGRASSDIYRRLTRSLFYLENRSDAADHADIALDLHELVVDLSE